MKKSIIITSLIALSFNILAEENRREIPLKLELSLLSSPISIGNLNVDCDNQKFNLELSKTSFFNNSPTAVLTNTGIIPLNELSGFSEVITTKGPDDIDLQKYLEDYTQTAFKENTRFNEGIKSNTTHLLKMLEYFSNGSTDAAFQYLEDNLKQVSTNQKISFLSNFLRELYEKYDYEALKDSFADFDDEALLKSLNVIVHNDPDQDKYKAGVCRHMHLLALTMARRMGLKQSYAVSYVSGIGYHLNLYINNPDNPREIYRLDYGSVLKQKNIQGTHALMIDRNNSLAGISTHFWGEKHNPIFFQPSQKGLLFNDLTGGSKDDYSQSMQPERKSITASYKLTPNKKITATYTELPSNGEEHVYALSLNHDKKPTSGTYFNYGFGIYGANRNPNQNTVMMESEMRLASAPSYRELGGFGRAEVGYLNTILDNNNVKIKMDNKLILRTQLFHSSYNENNISTKKLSYSSLQMNKFLIDGNGQIISQTHLEHKPTKSELKIGADLSGQVSDINSTSGVALYPRRLFASAQGKIPLGGSSEITLDSGIDHFPLDGDHSVIFNSNLSISKNNGRDSLGFRLLYPLNEAPAFLYGSRPTMIGNAQYHLIDDVLIVGITGHYSPAEIFEENIDLNSNDQPGDYSVSYATGKIPEQIGLSFDDQKNQFKMKRIVPSDYGFGFNFKLQY